jgi:hypothetical protein
MSAVSQSWCSRYGISCIDLQLMPGVVETADQVCNLNLQFDEGYSVEFKLLGESALLGKRISSIKGDGRVSTAAGVEESALEEELETFFKSIEGRLARIQHEEEVQGITFLGNTFVLNNKTVFDVVADEEGRLTIEMHKGEERQQAMLLASSLLDGLYDRSIVIKR